MDGYGYKVVCLWVKLTRDKVSYLALPVNLIQPTVSCERSLNGGAVQIRLTYVCNRLP